MPKKVFDVFFNALERDIKNNYRPGDKYFSIRHLAERHGVSIQTAQHGIKRLEEQGYISVKRKSGITVASLKPCKKFEGYKIAVISASRDTWFNNAFLEGIKGSAAERNISVQFKQMPDMNPSSMQFGEYLLSLGVNGIIALYFRNSSLSFYHAMREGMDIVSDIIPDDLPVLPAVQTDNRRHSREAGLIFRKRGYRRLLVVSFSPQKGNRRFEGMYEAIKDTCDDIQFVCLSDKNSISAIDTFFRNFNSRCAVYSTDHSSNYLVGEKFVQHRVAVKNDNFLVYDCERECFAYGGLNAVKRVGPSFVTLGAELCNALIVKQESGFFPIPLQCKI